MQREETAGEPSRRRRRAVVGYAEAWQLLNERLDEKTNWGRVELRQLMLECLIKTGLPPGTALGAT